MSEALEGVRDPRRLRVRVGLAFVRILRPALYALLVASALLTFWAGREIGGRELSPRAAAAAPILFAIFLVVFAVYRLALVRAKKYPAATGLFQIGLGALVWVLLLPGSRQRIGHDPGDEVQVLMRASDPRVRALAAEVAGWRGDTARYASDLVELLDDTEPDVGRAAHRALVRLAGTDASPGEEGSVAQRKWRDALAARGLLR
ncbi:MAG TPA: HEAT repeat domain-containing protein [Myxococcales bacterium]|nr:HEAT repeat domain-containing protein [Myxococcales bacterium]